MSEWITYSPSSGHGNGTISITADTLTELQDRISTIVAHTNYDGVSASTEILQTYKNVTGISITNLTWVDNIPWYGGVATKSNCSYSVIAYYEDGTSDDITSLAVVTGETVVDSTTSTTVTTAGTLTLTASYNQLIDTASTTFQSTGTITIYQDEYGHTDNKSEYLTFSILENGSIKYQYNINPSIPIVGKVAKQIYYSINGGEWISSSQNVHYTIINVSAGDTIRFKGENEVYWDNDSFFQDDVSSRFSQTPLCNIYGNILSMNYGDNFRLYTELPTPSNPDYDWGHFEEFFKGTSVISASGLWLPTPHAISYNNMFANCTNLSTAPKLSATTLANGCYRGMFGGCTSLTTAPELPATTLASECYSGMFIGCTSLTTAQLPATTLAHGCYMSMFYGCTSLTTAPELPVTTLSGGCYAEMFRDCTSLTTAPELPATTLQDGCYEDMFSGCTSLTTAPELPATTLAGYCYDYMFYGCTSLTTAPELPATTLQDGCYRGMFGGCTSLNYIKCHATDITAAKCTSDWVDGVAATGTFVKNPNMSGWTRGVDGIPSGWTVIDAT